MPRKRRAPQPVRRIDPAALAEFQAGIRKRYSNEEILEQLRACAERLGRSPTMREFDADPETTVHPQTVIQHFKSWNEAKRQAGLVPRRFAKPADLSGSYGSSATSSGAHRPRRTSTSTATRCRPSPSTGTCSAR